MRFKVISFILAGALALIAGLFIRPGDAVVGDAMFSPTAESARIVFYSPPGNFGDLLGRPFIFVNGTAYARIARGTYFYIDVASGLVVACIWKPDHDCHK